MKAQIQLGESIFVVIIIILLIVFGIIFYAQATRDDVEREQQSFQDLETITISQFATNLVELQCSLQEVQFPNCYDVTKLDALVKLLFNVGEDAAKELYFSQFGNAKIELTQVYPEIGGGNPQPTWLIYDNPPVVQAGISVSPSRQVTFPVSLYYPVEGTYSFGLLTLTQYVS